MDSGGIAFVAGATGYTGREVVREAVEAGLRTVAHVRPDSPHLEQWQRRFGAMGAHVDATPWRAEAMTATMTALGPSLVFALLGTTRARRREVGPEVDESYEAVDYGLTLILLRAAVACESSPRFVYLSSLGTGPRARSGYLAARWKAEQAVAASGLSYAIARPSIITGPGRDEFRAGERLAGKLMDGVLTLAGGLGGQKLRDHFHSTTSGGLARALLRLGLDRGLSGGIFAPEQLR